MPRSYSSYIKEIHKQTGYLAIWPPDLHLELGTILRKEGALYTAYSSLSSLGIRFDDVEDPTAATWVYQTEGGVELTFKGSGEASPTGWDPVSKIEAGLQIVFRRNHGLIVALSGIRERRIGDLRTVDAAILNLPEGEWDADYAVVTQVRDAACATILLATSSGARLEVHAKAGIRELADLANPEVKLSIKHGANLSQQFVAKQGMTPFFRARRLKQSILAPATHLVAMSDDDSSFFEMVTPDELLNE